MSRYYRSLIQTAVSAPFLDLYPGAYAAWSLEKLRTAYSGNCIRVRRSGDNAEEDIGFVDNYLDTAALLTFVGSGNGFVTTWYDQSGTGLNFVQATLARQPRIVNGGVLETANNKASLRGDGSNYRMEIASSQSLFKFLYDGSKAFTLSVQKLDVTTAFRNLYGNNNDNSANVGLGFILNAKKITAVASRGVSGATTNTTFYNDILNVLDANQSIIAHEIDSENPTAAERSKVYLNNGGALALNTLTNTPSTANSTGLFSLFSTGGGSNLFLGDFQELIIYNSDQSANRVAIRDHRNAFYNTF
jgi:hypothetical protein